jgi:hypothetical protein
VRDLLLFLHLFLPFPSLKRHDSNRAKNNPTIEEINPRGEAAFKFPLPQLTVILRDRSAAKGTEGPAVVPAFALAHPPAVVLAFALVFALPTFERA